MAENQPAVIWCPNCGSALAASVEIFSVNKHGDHQVKVQFSTQYVQHACGAQSSV